MINLSEVIKCRSYKKVIKSCMHMGLPRTSWDLLGLPRELRELLEPKSSQIQPKSNQNQAKSNQNQSQSQPKSSQIEIKIKIKPNPNQNQIRNRNRILGNPGKNPDRIPGNPHKILGDPSQILEPRTSFAVPSSAGAPQLASHIAI